MSYILIIILLCVIYSKNREIKNLEKQVRSLKAEIKKLKESGVQGQTTSNIYDVVTQDMTQEIPQKEVIQKAKPKESMRPEDKKNVSILIAGSVLIILAAIVFLTTAWTFMPTIIKTITLFLFVGVFLGASQIAKDKFHLEKASQTFFYIAMAYLPICLLSISLFGLFGEYLSVWGDGRFVYLGFSCLILAGVYYVLAKRDGNKYLLYGSVLSQLFSIILFTLLFDERIYLCCINVLLYNLILIFACKDTVFKTVSKWIPICTAVVVAFSIGKSDMDAILASLLVAINCLCIELDDHNGVTAFGFNYFLLQTGFNLILNREIGLSAGTQQILLLLYIVPVLGIEHLVLSSKENAKNILVSSRILSCIALSFIYLFSYYEAQVIIPSSIVGMMLMGVLLLCFRLSDNMAYKYGSYILLNFVLYDFNRNFVNEKLDINYLIPLFSRIIVQVLETLFSKEKDKVMDMYYGILEVIALIAICAKINMKYVTDFLFLAWSVGRLYFAKTQRAKDLFMTFTIGSLTALYYLVCEDAGLMEITIIKMLGALVAGYIVIKGIAVHYYQNTDGLEYFFWAYIYLSGIASYTNEIDGILFSILILGIIFGSYQYGLEVAFLSGILAIIANGFLLTRAFWLAIPWWIYLLVIGGALIAFGVRNEANENKITVKGVLNNIKDVCKK